MAVASAEVVAIMSTVGVPITPMVFMPASTIFVLIPAPMQAVVVAAALPGDATISVAIVIVPMMMAVDPVAGAVVIVPTIVESIVPVVCDEERVVIDHNDRRRRDYDGGRRNHNRRGCYDYRRSDLDANADAYLRLGLRRKVHGQSKSKSCECGFLVHS